MSYFQRLNDNKPFTNLSSYYNKRFVREIEKTFKTDVEICVVRMFYDYFNDSEPRFFLSLDRVWQFIGFKRKETCLRVMKDISIEGADYVIDNDGDMLLEFEAFQDLCFESKTKRGREILSYLEKLTEIVNDILCLHMNEFQLQCKKEVLLNECDSLPTKTDTLEDQLRKLKLNNEILKLEVQIRDIRDSI